MPIGVLGSANAKTHSFIVQFASKEFTLAYNSKVTTYH